MSLPPIPFNRPAVVGEEFRYMAEAVARGRISGAGEFSRRCEELLAAKIGAAKVLLTTSCTHALEMSALLLDLAPGDEVVIPSFAFVSAANAFALRGARPVFADVREDTLNLDESRLEGRIGPSTRAVVALHYAGVACAMEAILEIAGRRGVAVVEDAAHGLFGRYRDRPLGSFGRLSALSFHETKNLTCGEGGALVVNDPALIPRAEVLREKGTDRCRFFRGEVDKYTWVDLGSSYLPSEILAAFLWAQLERRHLVQAARRRVWERYARELASWAEPRGVRLPAVPPGCEQPYHLFYLLLPSLTARQALIAHLAARGILAVFHYVPLHLSEFGRKAGGGSDCPVAAAVADRLVRLPLYYELGEDDQDRVIEAVRSFEP